MGLQVFPETPDIETSSDDYASRFSGKAGAWFLKIQEDATLRMLRPFSGARVLDVGGGHGQLTGALVENGYNVTVLSSSHECRNRIQRFVDEGRCDFKVGNILELPFVDDEFDVVISYRLVPHVNDWNRLLQEMTRVARKAVIVDYPPIRSLNYIEPLMFRFKKIMEGNTRHYTSFWESDLLDGFKARGFAKDDRYPEFFLPMVLHRILKSPALSSVMEGFCRRLGLTRFFGSPVILKVVRMEP